jgi:hypothetical protein
MPAMLVHYSFVLEAIPQDEVKYLDAVRLGGQGPDPFFYYGVKPWNKPLDYQAVSGYGSTLHHTDFTDTYYRMIEYAKKSCDRDFLLAYIDGLLMHYVVDRTCHQYIFAESGFDENGKLTGYYKWSHGAYEALLDETFSKRKGTYMKPSRCIAMSKDKVMLISKMWAECTEDPKLTPTSFYTSWKSYKLAMNVLWSPTGFKRLFFRMGGQHSLAYGMSYPHHLKKYAPMDILNEAHRAWLNCVTKQVRTESFDDLWQICLKDYQKAHQILEKARLYEDGKDDLRKFVGSQDHDGFHIGLKKKVFDLCWNRLPR